MSRGAAFERRGLAPILCVPLALLAAHLSPSGGEALRVAGLGAVVIGLAVRAAVIAHVPHQTSGRGSRLVARVLNTDGLYSVVRHPLYLGNLSMWLGGAAFSAAWWMPIVAGAVIAASLPAVIRSEDRFLAAQFGVSYSAWAADTRALLPRMGRWRAPALPFSTRTVFRRESTTWMAAAGALFVLHAVRRHATEGSWTPAFGAWVWIGAAAAIWAVVHALKYRTRVLHVPGR